MKNQHTRIHCELADALDAINARPQAVFAEMMFFSEADAEKARRGVMAHATRLRSRADALRLSAAARARRRWTWPLRASRPRAGRRRWSTTTTVRLRCLNIVMHGRPARTLLSAHALPLRAEDEEYEDELENV